jgi:hypothetical protein
METSASFEARSAPSPYPTGPLRSNKDLGFCRCQLSAAVQGLLSSIDEYCFARALPRIALGQAFRAGCGIAGAEQAAEQDCLAYLPLRLTYVRVSSHPTLCHPDRSVARWRDLQYPFPASNCKKYGLLSPYPSRMRVFPQPVLLAFVTGMERSASVATGSELQIPPLRYASVGMTKCRVATYPDIG